MLVYLEKTDRRAEFKKSVTKIYCVGLQVNVSCSVRAGLVQKPVVFVETSHKARRDPLVASLLLNANVRRLQG